MILEDAAAPPREDRQSIVKAYALTHGTNDVYNLKETRQFYEEFLGLEVVRHAPPGMVFRLGMKFHVVCLEVGDKVLPKTLMHHWGLDVGSKEEVDEAWKKAHEYKDTYKIKQIMPIEFQHGVYSFYFEDMNHTWWEIQYYDGFLHDDFFDFGDRFDPDGKPLSGAA
ncbi:glyoxalase/bleomycin resistance/dioxygenase family protein [Pseudoxanthomonas jiangsuensis]|uniref:VOC family protein n=1 Tax=Pseudoxanthomonas jiangsuensis TaxID=619688 RepID=UPI0013910EC3|nr:VOC family protein [Pseudoxanthomonas jiangsuensis]KAF1697262.1 glyoxalase/bleomycin resistance/dioxygenase family protein [Pseudoxanthomonas jiangsuensis]